MPTSIQFEVEPNVDKIAVLRANALGDFILALPALDALRSFYPEAEIVLLARGWHQSFLSHRPGPVDRVVVIPEGGIGNESQVPQSAIELEQFFQAMTQEKFDLAIQLHGGGRNSNPFTLRLGARVTVGLRTLDAPLLDRWVPYVLHQPEILRYLEVVSLVGATTSRLEPFLAVTEADRVAAQQLVPTGQPLVALHPGATDFQRSWPVEKFAAVGDALVASGTQVVVTGTEPERYLVEGVVAKMKAKATNLCGCLSLNGLTGLLSRCSVVISNDSGPLHLAAAVGTATVGIYWCGNLIMAGPITRTYHRPSISWRLTCPVCGTNYGHTACNHDVSLVDEIPVEEVIASALDLLALSSQNLEYLPQKTEELY